MFHLKLFLVGLKKDIFYEKTLKKAKPLYIYKFAFFKVFLIKINKRKEIYYFYI